VRGLRAAVLALTGLGALGLAACRGGVPPPCCPGAAQRSGTGAAPIQVAVSVPPQAYFVERIGGSRVRVEVMIPPGYSHVDYPLTPRRMVALSHAALYVKVGHPGFEFETRQIDPFLAQTPGIRVIDMSRGMRFLETGHSEGHVEGDGADGHDHGGSDPHVWVTPATVAVAAVNIERGLEAADPAHAGEYRANLRRFLDDIRSLDRDIRGRLEAPSGSGTAGPEGRAFMVYHPTWGYFAQEYGLKQIAIESEGREPSALRLIQLIEEARRDGVKVVFVQEGFPRKSAQVIAEAVGGRVVTADPQQFDWLANLRHVAAELEATRHHA